MRNIKIETFTNKILPIHNVLEDELMTCSHSSIASAFIDESTITLLEKVLKKNVKLKKITLIVGLYGCFNRKKDLEKLSYLAKKFTSKIQTQISLNKKFHWKYFQFEKGKKITAYIGSANFTSGGLRHNGELLVKIETVSGDTGNILQTVIRAFEGEIQFSRSILEFKLNEYIQEPIVIKNKSKNTIGNKEFFSVKDLKSHNPNKNENVLVCLMTGEVSAQTERILENTKPDWYNFYYYCCASKRLYEKSQEVKKILLITKNKGSRYSVQWVRCFEPHEIPTPDGRFFIAYEGLSSIGGAQKIKILTDPKYEWGLNLNARKRPFRFKIMRKEQASRLEKDLNLKIKKN